jgi:DNA-binding NtrC family response regulator
MGTTLKPCLLVVEDDGLIRLDLVDTLEDMGFRVLNAKNADEALEVLEATDEVVAVLTDIDMPGSINGIGLAKAVHERWPPLKVIVVSGRYDPAAGVLPPGAKFLTKPVTETVINQILREIGVAD